MEQRSLVLLLINLLAVFANKQNEAGNEKVKVLRDLLGEIQGQLQHHQARIEQLHATIEKQDDVIRNQERIMEQQLRHNAQQNATMEELQRSVTDIVLGYDSLVANQNPIGFTAIANRDAWYQPGETVRFQSVLTNLGGLYNDFTSRFNCIVPGVYLFTTRFNAYFDTKLFVVIMRDGSPLVEGWAEHGGRRNEHSSALVVAECVTGQDVYVMCTYDSGQINGQNSGLSHFSGYLLYRYD